MRHYGRTGVDFSRGRESNALIGRPVALLVTVQGTLQSRFNMSWVSNAWLLQQQEIMAESEHVGGRTV